MTTSAWRAVRIGLVLSVVTMLLAGGGLLWLRRPAHPVTVDQVIERFRAQVVEGDAASSPLDTTPLADGGPSGPTTSAAPGPSSAATPSGRAAPASPPAPGQPDLPAPGVYVYDTSGFEEVDAFGGARHDYPEQTTITVVREGCGSRFRWQPLRERWEEWTTCPVAAGERPRQLVVFHEFAGQSDRRQFTCDETSLIRPASPQPGTTFGARCPGDKSNFTSKGTVVGVEPVIVGGQTVETVHVRVEWEQTGSDIHSIRRIDQWLHVKNGLLVRQTYEDNTEGQQGPIKARYKEQYELRLASLTPRQ